jgi:hypothetical protein
MRASRRFELAGSGLGSARERSLLVAEQLAFEQVIRDSRTVDGDELQMRPPGKPVDRAGQQLLARAAVAQQQHRGVGWSNLLYHAAHAAHGIAHTNDAIERHRAGSLPQAPVLLLQLANPERASHDDGQHAAIERFVIEIGGAESHGRDGKLAGVMLGHRDDLGVRGEIQDLTQQLQALGRDGRLASRAQIEQDHVRLQTPDQDERLLRSLGRCDLEIRKDLLELTAQAAIVLQNEKLASLHLRSRQQHLYHACSRLPTSSDHQDFTLKCKEDRHFLCASRHRRGASPQFGAVTAVMTHGPRN